ncbi:MAG TPA: pseudouridine synthase, partial [Aquabacterium sp.]|nr:pseudouridine synthase [Aquabacterium sp.]
MRNGVSASCVALPAGSWATVLDFLTDRIPAVARDDWHQRMAAGEVVTAQGEAIAPHTPYREHARRH